MLSEEKGHLLEKSYFSPQSIIYYVILWHVEDGYLAKKPAQLHTYNLIFHNIKAFSCVPGGFWAFFWRKATIHGSCYTSIQGQSRPIHTISPQMPLTAINEQYVPVSRACFACWTHNRQAHEGKTAFCGACLISWSTKRSGIGIIRSQIMEIFLRPIIYSLLSGKHTWNCGFSQESITRDIIFKKGSMYCRINNGWL